MTPETIAQGILLALSRICGFIFLATLLYGIVGFVWMKWSDKQEKAKLKAMVEHRFNYVTGRILEAPVQPSPRQAPVVRPSPRISSDCTPVIPRGAHALANIRP